VLDTQAGRKTYECRAWSPGILLARLLEMASVQAALGRSTPEEELREVVGWAYRREVLATLQQRVSAIGAIVEQEYCTVQEQVLACLQEVQSAVQEVRLASAL
jgi:predicted anti-sigma-YlaC factor YlaD